MHAISPPHALPFAPATRPHPPGTLSPGVIRVIRAFDVLFLLMIAISAFGGGYYGMNGAEGVPLAWLEGSPFASYYVPSLFLFAVIGGGCLLASALVFSGKPIGRKAGMYAAYAVLFWIGAQLAVIGPKSFLQPFVVVIGLTMAIASWLLPER